ncbi:diphthine synthase [Halomicrobium salinisoli]|uniref:diphthine synthase n=1 Tax=Halomicrobium salinisoli TaxID=2878391 RepID=UPI001CEFFA3E|nr:diphthine synthase [Halomicrobium salinisoli]
MLTFVGLGLYDERSITVEGKEALQTADRAFAEFYTSRLVGADHQRLEYYLDTDLEVLDRATVEQDPERVLAAAEDEDVVFATAGDTMVSTTHVDLRLRARERGIHTRVVHGTTAQTAASSLTGLQNYRFGKATTLPFEDAHGADGVPDSVVETIEANRERDLHTLVYLDIKVDDPHWEGEEEFMTADRAADLLSEPLGDALGVAVARAGSATPVVEADRLSELADGDFGGPLHLLVVPGDLHDMERDALRELAGAPEDAL